MRAVLNSWRTLLKIALTFGTKILASVHAVKPINFVALTFLLFGLSFFSIAHAEKSNPNLTPVTLQLKWLHQFQFAGYYAAIEQGYYQQAGLEVTLIEAEPGTDTIQRVLDGHADFGVGTSELLLHYHQGKPLVVLAAIMQHSPLALAALSKSGATNIHQLAAEPMMIEPNSLELLGYLKKEGVDIRQLNLVEHSFGVDELLSGEVKSLSVYITDEPYLFAEKGLEVQYFQPITAGIDFYGDNLFTRQTLLNQRPDLVELGYMNPGRWQHIAQVYAQLDLLPKDIEIEGLLYQTPDLAYQKIKQQLFYASLAILFIGLLAGLFYRLFYLANRRKKRFEALFIHAPTSLIEIDQQGTILHWNHEAQNTFHYSEHEAIGQNVFDLLVANEAKAKVKALIAQTFEHNSLTYSENENRCKNGETLLCLWTNMPIDLGTSHSKRILCMARDITQEKHMAQQLYQAAHYDALTGLPNRRLMLDLLKQVITQANKQQTALAILFIDLNGFKAINDTHGHQVGDEVLKIVAKRIPQTLQQTDLFGRLSGDEFLVVINPVTDATAIQTQIETIRHSLAQPMQTDQHTLHISASIGVSLYPQDAQDIEQLVRIADQSMYKVKAQHNAQHKPQTAE
jgi:diguanylate cyclase (GGDEF)-like protein/PAS domain S-box-containing protein